LGSKFNIDQLFEVFVASTLLMISDQRCVHYTTNMCMVTLNYVIFSNNIGGDMLVSLSSLISIYVIRSLKNTIWEITFKERNCL